MAHRTHLFVAVASETWGEVVIALRIAAELHDRGETVLFLAPRSMEKLFSSVPFRHGWIDSNDPRLHLAIPEIARRERCDCVVLVDAALVYMKLEGIGACEGFLDRFAAPVIALDVWDLAKTNMAWDFGPNTWTHTPHALDAPMRLIPSPLADPSDGGADRFAALPNADVFCQSRGGALRAEMGLSGDDPLVLLPTASWQRPEAQMHAYNARLAATFPAFLASLLNKLDAGTRVAQLGPVRYDVIGDVLGSRFRWFPQVSPDRFADFISAADLLLSFNASATSIGCAIAAGLPVLLGINSARGDTVEELVAEVPTPSPELHRWLAENTPLHPFSVWPFGYSDFLAPILDGNAYSETMRVVELLREQELVSAASELLSSAPARNALIERQATFADAVRRLPSGADVVLRHLASA